jgi:hydrogenase nickel incorporation protein HypB
MRVIELKASVSEENDRTADEVRRKMKEQGTLLVNLMSSPGSGKTTLLGRIIDDIGKEVRIGVVEADIDAKVDAERIVGHGARSIQVHTDGMCHMDAGMTKRSLDEMGCEGLDLAFLENVGNLICPAEFDTGAGLDVMILSVPEGDDKPLKYPLMFMKSHALVITKTDTLPVFDFNMDECIARARKLNPDIQVFPVSAKTGEGMEALENWLIGRMDDWKNSIDATSVGNGCC